MARKIDPARGRRYPRAKKGSAGVKEPPQKETGTAFRIKLRGKDNAPLSMAEVRQGLLEAARRLKDYDGYRAKWVTLYLTVVDADGNEVLPDPKGEWTLHPYKSAAEEFRL
jgi:hypothetical protein